MPGVHLLLLAETLPAADRLASAWRNAAPHTTMEVRDVQVPGAGMSSGLPIHGPQGDGSGDLESVQGREEGRGYSGVLISGAMISVGRPDTSGRSEAGQVHPGRAIPGPAPSSLSKAKGAELREVAAGADVVVTYVPHFDGGYLQRGVVVEAVVAAAEHAIPVIVVTDRQEVSRREWSTAGLSGVYEITGYGIARVAQTWSPVWAR